MDATIGTSRIAPLAFLAVAGLALAGCQPAEQGGMEEGATSGEEAAASLSSQEVIEMERGLWEALAQGDHAGFAEKIADDATLLGGQGVTDKQEMMSMLEGATIEAYEVTDFQVMQPGSGVAVVTYHYSETYRPAEADSAMTYAGWATSIWENRDGTWMAVFHQSTEEMDGME
jgi:hypothetical protein